MADPEPLDLPCKRPIPRPATPSPKTQQTQPKFLSNFLYKAIFVVVLVALLPLFPSQAPEFVNQSILTRSWELIHLLFVGIIVSYGLFSRRNADPEAYKEAPWKADSPQAYVSRIIQASSVFDDDEADAASGFPDDTKIQTWSSQHCRGEPVVVVAKGGSTGDNSSNKPVSLPVRSLKPRAQGPEMTSSCDENDGYSGSDDGPRSASNTMDEIGRRGSFRASDALRSKDDVKESVVLPSPIPWRSRSGRMEVKDESVPGTSVISPSPVIGADLGPSRTPSFRSSVPRSTSTTPSQKQLSPSPSLSPELRAKSSEDSGKKKKSFYKSSPPPPPPPPPLPVVHGSLYISDKRDTRRSFKDELKDKSKSGMGGLLRSDELGIDSSRLETKPKNHANVPSVGRSVRTVRWKEVQGAMLDKATKPSPDESLEELGCAIHQPPPPPLPPRLNEKKHQLMEKVIIASDDSDSDSVGESSDIEDASSSAVEAEPDENEVDKKADEFIAKFREQIRLQRIESIKRSSGHGSVRKNPK